jgi:hypothetical protein
LDKKFGSENLVQIVGRGSLLNRPKQLEILELRKFALEEYKDPDFIPMKGLKNRLQNLHNEKTLNTKFTFNEWQNETHRSNISEFNKSDDNISSRREEEEDSNRSNNVVLQARGLKDSYVMEALDRLKNASL